LGWQTHQESFQFNFIYRNLSHLKNMDFKQLKKQSSLGSLTEKLLKEAEKMGSSSSSKDERIFTVERDKSGLGMAIIRFLPPPLGEDNAFIKLYNHGFQVNGKWFIENCPTTLDGGECPVCSANTVLWNSGLDSNKKIASSRKRKLNYYSNVYVVKNPANPELEGTVMLFRYGKKIFDKIISAMKPQFEGEDPIAVFDMWEGANFKIKVKTVKESSGSSYPNYDDSSFMAPSPLSDDDEELESIWNQCHSLQDLISSDKFKSGEELQKRLDSVLGARQVPSSTQMQEEELEDTFSSSTDVMEELEQNYTRSSSVIEDDEDMDNTLARFQELAG
jgi:hypothetical protein